MKNPYHPSEDSEYQSWQHGYQATSLGDNPYEGQDPELEAIWLEGFNSKKRSPGRPPKAKQEDAPALPMEKVVDRSEALFEASTEELEKELIRRKKMELEALVEQEESISKVLTDVQLKIYKIKMFVGE